MLDTAKLPREPPACTCPLMALTCPSGRKAGAVQVIALAGPALTAHSWAQQDDHYPHISSARWAFFAVACTFKYNPLSVCSR